MPFQRQRPDLILSDEDNTKLQAISKSGKEPFEKVRRAKMLLAYSKKRFGKLYSKNNRSLSPNCRKVC